MVEVEFVGDIARESVFAAVSERTPLVDVCDDARAPVEFSCRSASCGTCRIEVLDGAQLLEPPKADELDVLSMFEPKDSHRLACQAVVREGSGKLKLRWLED